MAVPVKFRSHELGQMHDMLPAVQDDLERAELDEAADIVERIYDEHVHGVSVEPRQNSQFAAYVSMPAEDWRLAVRYLGRATRWESKNRVQWLRQKLIDRLEDRMEELD